MSQKRNNLISNAISYKEIFHISNNGISLCNIAIFMIIIVGLISIFSSIQLLCKIPIHFPFAIIATLVILAILTYKKIFKLQESLISILCCLLFCWISSKAYDFTWDGQAYHQLSILMFSEGWNPYWDNEKIGTYYDDIWVYGYPKSLWIFSTAIYEITHNILVGKVYNLLFTFSTFLLCFDTFKRYLPNHKIMALSISLLTAFNPVVICQLFTYYIDSTLYLLMIDMLMISFLWIKTKNKILLFALSVVIILMCNTKFTGAVYAVVIGLTLLAIFHLYYFSLLKQLFNTMFISGIIGIFVIGYNPYITNFIRHGNIGWPIMGDNKIDIVTPQGPKDLVSENRIKKLFISNNSFAHNDNVSTPVLKFPGQIGKFEYLVYSAPDVRIGGFGPLYNIIFIYTMIMMCLILFNKSIKRKEKILIIGLVVSILSNPECWWARYIPQMYFLSIITIIISYKATDLGFIRNYHRYICIICIAILTINLTFVSAGYFRKLKSNISLHSHNIERLKYIYNESGRDLYVTFHKLDSRRLSVFEANEIKILDSKKNGLPNGYDIIYKDSITEIYKYNKGLHKKSIRKQTE